MFSLKTHPCTALLAGSVLAHDLRGSLADMPEQQDYA
jgi:hypothetical protein